MEESAEGEALGRELASQRVAGSTMGGPRMLLYRDAAPG